jgi:hypothetical protein
MKIEHAEVGRKVWAIQGAYTPTSYREDGTVIKHKRGTIVDVLPPNVVVVRFDGYPNTVDMIARELVPGFWTEQL